MKISVQNLGAIKEGSISLDKNLTVLVGPNNSGKSYMAYLIYGILRDKKWFTNFDLSIAEDEISKDENGWNVVNLKEAVLRRITLIQNYMRKYAQSKIKDYFASNKIKPSIFIDVPFWEQQIELALEDALKSANETRFNSSTFLLEGDFFKYKENVGIPMSKLLLGQIITDVVFQHSISVHFFPAERLALSMLSNNEVERKSKLQDKLGMLLLESEGKDDYKLLEKILAEREHLKPNYPQAINDYIYFINDLKDTVKQQGDYEDFANQIQEMLMEGNVSVSTFGDINYTPKGTNDAIEIHISSSLVKSLSGLILYFRHLAEEGDMIIIDEPEVNLHPNYQRIIARVIAKIINKGFKIILSTHSDYIIKELNNLVMLNKANENPTLKAELLKDLASNGYDADCYLDKKDLGVYFFNNQTIEELKVDDMGFDVSSIDTELDKLNYASEHIYYTLFKPEA